jgi:hypothetical protein
VETSVLILHALAVRKSGTPAQIAAATGLSEEDVRAGLHAATAMQEVNGARDIFILMPSGRARLDDLYPEVYAEVRADADFVAAADRFEAVNRKLLDLLTRWQSVPQAGTTVPNDHSDAAYDTAILDELGDLHERAEPILDAFAAAVPRMKAYADRLAGAYDRALAGETDYVSGVRVDSFHTVWHELHEDLLRVLGRTRQE